MKTLPSIFLLFFTLTAAAQPDIKKNIFVTDKHCWVKEPYSFSEMSYSNGAFYALTGGNNLLFNNPPNNLSGLDIVLVKIDATTYDTVWTKIYGGSKEDANTFMRLRTLPNGNVLIAGRTESSDMDFVMNTVPGSRAIYFLEIDTSGQIMRTKILTGSSGAANGSVIRDVTVDSMGNIYAVGDTWYDNMDFAHIQNGKDGWIFKMDSSFTKEWMNFWIGYNSDQCFGVGIANNGNVIVTGSTGDTGTVAMLGSLDKGRGDLFVQAYAPDGSTLWNGRYGGSQNDYGWSVVYGTNTRNIYLIGYTVSPDGDIAYHTASLDSFDTTRLGNTNVWIVQLDTLGNLMNSKAYGTRATSTMSQMETFLDAAIWHRDNLWLALRTINGGGDFEPVWTPGGQLLIGTIDTNANLTAKFIFKDTAQKYITNFFKINNQLYAAGNSNYYDSTEIGTAFRCDPTTIETNLIIGFDEAPLSVPEITRSKPEPLFTISPNPGHTSFRIRLAATLAHESADLVITNTSGAKIIQSKLSSAEDTIDCSHWPSGLYYISLYIQHQSQTLSFLKQ